MCVILHVLNGFVTLSHYQQPLSSFANEKSDKPPTMTSHIQTLSSATPVKRLHLIPHSANHAIVSNWRRSPFHDVTSVICPCDNPRQALALWISNVHRYIVVQSSRTFEIALYVYNNKRLKGLCELQTFLLNMQVTFHSNFSKATISWSWILR